MPGVDLAIPMVEGPACGSSTSLSTAAALWCAASREADIKRLPGIASNVHAGTLDGFDTAGGVAIGQRLAENLSLRVGDKIKVMTANGAQTPFGVAPRVKAYPVVAIFQIGMAEFDTSFVYMPLPEAQAFFNLRQAGKRHRTLSSTTRKISTPCASKIEQVGRRGR